MRPLLLVRFALPFGVAVVLLAGCRTAAPPAADPGPLTRQQAATIREEVMAADRGFAAATAAARLTGWMSYYAPDAARLTMGQTATRGLDSIRAADARLFADPAYELRWEPTDGGAFADGRHAFTTGTSEFVHTDDTGTETVTYRGVYITFWRREPDGRWLVVLDTGADREE